MPRPISFIMRAEPEDLDEEDLKAGIAHTERMQAFFREHQNLLERELAGRNVDKQFSKKDSGHHFTERVTFKQFKDLA